jgi:general secretion pathway protein H
MTSRFDSRPSLGFTLLELLVVLAIMGLIAALIVGGRSPASDSVTARATAATLAAALRETRARAIGEGRPISFLLDVAGRRFAIDKPPDQALSPTLGFALLTGRGDVVRQGLGRVRFFPDGSSTGGRIDIDASTRKMSVGIDWISGRVSFAER